MTIEQVGRAIWQRTKHLNPETISRWESDLAALGVSPEDARSVFVKDGLDALLGYLAEWSPPNGCSNGTDTGIPSTAGPPR